MHSVSEISSRNYPKVIRKKKPWWTQSCTLARNRNRLFHSIWVSMGKPKEGQAYMCHKEARKAYKKTCQQAVNNVTNNRFSLINRLSRENQSRRMWDIVRKSRKRSTTTNAIKIKELEQYFRSKFSVSPESTKVMVDADSVVKDKLQAILKKPNIDPTLPKHYRPITISVIISKLFEHHILDTCSDHDFSTSQYGFIPERGSDKAAALAHDVAVYANVSGSTVFYCSLDAEGAFDFLPHSVLLEKALGITPDEHWRCIHNWYAEMCIHIKWCSLLGEEIPVER